MDLLSQEDLATVHSRYTHKSSAPPGVLLGFFHVCLLSVTTKGSWISCGRVAKTLVSPLTPVPPGGVGGSCCCCCCCCYNTYC